MTDHEPDPDDAIFILDNLAVDKITGCWNWTGTLNPQTGYANFYYRGRMAAAQP